jgi:hypothetical protein
MYVFCRYRCSSHWFPVETGRWYNISRHDRLCHLCDSNDIGDEFHYVMTCSFFNNERKYYLPYYCQKKKNANILKFNQLFSSHNIVVLEKLCKFIKVITVKVSALSWLGKIFCSCTCTCKFVYIYVVYLLCKLWIVYENKDHSLKNRHIPIFFTIIWQVIFSFIIEKENITCHIILIDRYKKRRY